MNKKPFANILFLLVLLICMPVLAELGADWTQVTPIGSTWSQRCGHTNLSFDGKLWTIGGQQDGTTTNSKNDVWWSTDGQAWQKATDSAAFSARFGHTSVVFDGKMWVIGGCGPAHVQKSDAWWSTDGQNWNLATAAAGFTPRRHHTSLVFDNKIWVIAGFTDTGPPTTLADVWYSSDGQNWSEATSSAAFGARHTAGVVYGGRMWVLGGNSYGLTRFNDAWWSTDGATWNNVPILASFPARSEHVAAVIDNKMWVIAGVVSPGAHSDHLNDAWWSDDGATWTQAPQTPSSPRFSPRRSPGCAVFDNRVWITGGYNSTATFNDVWFSGREISYNPLNLILTDGLADGTAAPGSRVNYTIAFDNLDNTEDVHNVTIVASLPADLKYESATNGGEYIPATHTVEWNPGTLPAGADRQSLELEVSVASAAPNGTLIRTSVTIDSDETPPTTTNSEIVTSEFPSMEVHVVMGDARAYLWWGAAGRYGDFTYKVWVWKRSRVLPWWGDWELFSVFDTYEGEPIALPQSVVEGLEQSDWSEGTHYQYAFAVSAVDNVGVEVPDLAGLSQAQIDKLPKGEAVAQKPKLPLLPTYPIVFVPGVGSTLEDSKDSFKEVKNIFAEDLGWVAAPNASVLYNTDPYGPDKTPSSVHWNDAEPTGSPQIYTFVPFRPESGNEIGIKQKGRELDFFLTKCGAHGPFQLIGHSLGGLTCRAYIQRPDTYKNNIVRLVTIGTPHDGVAADIDASKYPGGLRDILLAGYWSDEWRKEAFKQDPVFRQVAEGVLELLEMGNPSLDAIFQALGLRDRIIEAAFDVSIYSTLRLTIWYLEDWDSKPETGWDFDGNTLKEDILNRSTFMMDLNAPQDGTFRELPAGISYVSLVGEVNSFWHRNLGTSDPVDVAEYLHLIKELFVTHPKNLIPIPFGGFNCYLGYGVADSDSSIVDGGDGIVSVWSQNLKNVTGREVETVGRARNHLDEQNDYIGFLMGLGYPVLSIKASCPVDLLVTAPRGQYITKGETAIFLADYQEIQYEGSLTPHDLVEIPFPESGDYKIEVIPEANAQPGDLFSLTVTIDNETRTIAENTPIASIPPSGYIVSVNTPPAAAAGPDQTVYAGGVGLADVVLDGCGSSDHDGDSLSYLWTWTTGAEVHTATGVSPTLQLPLGIHAVTLVVNDGKVDSDPDEVVIAVLDNTPPRLAVTVNPSVLYPPNHKMIRITTAVTATDNCDAAPRVALKSVSMNEGDGSNTYAPGWDDSVGDGNTSGDIQVDTSGNIFLRAERAGTGSGRVYTITYEARDASGNSSRASAQVTVPHDLGTR